VATVWQLLVHTSAPIGLPRWVAAVVVTPGAHRRHHEDAAAPVNLGGVLTVWDRLAGTWAGTAAGRPARDDRDPTPVDNPLSLELRPWIDLRRSHRTDAGTGRPPGFGAVGRRPRQPGATAQPEGSRLVV
jgi:hypothetical protein